VDANNIFFLGHSRGSAAALHCAIDGPSVPKGIAILAPSVTIDEFKGIEVLRQTPLLIVTGGKDPHYRDNGRKLFQMLSTKGLLRVQYRDYQLEDHFFTRGTDQTALFEAIFSFFGANRESE
jgi:predicted esterase